MLTWLLNLISQNDNFSYAKETQSVSQRDKCAETGDTWQCEILNTRILAAAAAAGPGTFLRRIQMKIGSESELDKSYGRGAQSKPANIVGGKLQIFLKIPKGRRKKSLTITRF